MLRKYTLGGLLLMLALAAALPARAQYADHARAWTIDSAYNKQLLLTLNSTLFFRDNEISTPMMKGYTLPGFRLAPTLDYQPDSRVKVQLGLYMLRFWGTDAYPNLAYNDIASWTGNERTAQGFHLLPIFRVQMATKGGLNLVLGSIYGGMHHHLIEPLYAPELHLTADPETGAQILYSCRWLDFDTWINWESFIYKGDTHQEEFTFGVSSRIKYNRPESRVHLYSPLQLLFQHRGGEIDTIYVNSVQTLFNGSAGLGARIDLRHRALRSLTLQADALLYNQQAGSIWPFDRGWAYYLHAHLQVSNSLRAKLGYYRSEKFASLFGYPFFGGMSVSTDGLTFPSNNTWLAGVDYNREISPGFMLGANVVVFRHNHGFGYLGATREHYPSSTSFCGSLYFRINPSFVLKSFNAPRQ